MNKGEEAWGRCPQGCWEILGHPATSRAPIGARAQGGWCGWEGWLPGAGQVAHVSESLPELGAVGASRRTWASEFQGGVPKC